MNLPSNVSVSKSRMVGRDIVSLALIHLRRRDHKGCTPPCGGHPIFRQSQTGFRYQSYSVKSCRYRLDIASGNSRGHLFLLSPPSLTKSKFKCHLMRRHIEVAFARQSFARAGTVRNDQHEHTLCAANPEFKNICFSSNSAHRIRLPTKLISVSNI